MEAESRKTQVQNRTTLSRRSFAAAVAVAPWAARTQPTSPHAWCITLAGLLRAAYGSFGDGVTINPQPVHMEGGPSWMQSD
jgi:hypothetical protein